MSTLAAVNSEALALFTRQLIIPLPAGLITLEKYRIVMAPTQWCLLTECFLNTRSYSEGFDAASLLFRATIDFHDSLTENERDRAYHILSLFILDMLDKLDRWEDYLSWFHFLRDSCTLYLRESESPEHRRMVTFNNKLEKKNAGKSTIHLLHHSKDKLSQDEINRRMNRAVEHANMKQDAVEYWTYYWEKKRSHI